MRSKQVRFFEISLAMIIGGALLLAGVAPAQAASKKDPAKEALRRVQLELRQAQDQKVVLEQDKAGLAQELEVMKKKSGELTTSAARANHGKAVLEKEVETSRQDKTKLSEELDRLRKELADSQSAERETRSNLKQETNQKQRLEQNLSARGKALEVCETKNKMLYQYHVELINRAQNRGSLGALLEAEPVLGFKRVQIENLLEEYRDKLDEQKINTTTFSEAPSK